MVHLWHAFNNTHSYSTNIFLLEIGLVLHQGLESFTRCEQAAYRLVHGKVGESHTQDLVGKVYEIKGMIDEEIAAHQLVDEEFLNQGRCTILRKYASRWGFEGGNME